MIRALGMLTLILCTGLATAADRVASAAVLRDCAECPELVVVPAGRFLMGTPQRLQVPTEVPAELDPVEITIGRPFALGRFEVTRGEYRAFVQDSGHSPSDPHCRTWVEALQGFRDLPVRWDQANTPSQPTDRHPAVCIDWHDAQAYVAWLSRRTGHRYRLPSEAEWEYAARGGTRTLYPWGNRPEGACRQANLHDETTARRYALAWTVVRCKDGYADVAPVGSLLPNRFGLHDMLGNVWEWAEDCASLSYFGRPTDQRAWVWEGGCRRRIQRGGGWITGPERTRPGFHGDGDDRDRAEFAGMRVARDL
jgi:formylglycine-generating enzyme required for sulfatase activity